MYRASSIAVGHYRRLWTLNETVAHLRVFGIYRDQM